MSTLDTLIVVERARELIEAGWTQGANARDAKGFKTDTESPEAVRFCAQGAILHAAIVGRHERGTVLWNHEAANEAAQLLNAAAGPGPGGVVSFNDAQGRTQGDVLELFRGVEAKLRLRLRAEREQLAIPEPVSVTEPVYVEAEQPDEELVGV